MEKDPSTWRLIGSRQQAGTRTATAYRDGFAALAERTRCIVLAPLFPVGLIEPGELSNFKRLKFHDMRFDLLLLAMVDEVERKYGIDARRFCLFGFSGGGQFVQRFYCLHPQRLSAVTIGAPGNVTLIDDGRDWWVGTRNFRDEFGVALDVAEMRKVRVQMIVGAEDAELGRSPSSRATRPGWRGPKWCRNRAQDRSSGDLEGQLREARHRRASPRHSRPGSRRLEGPAAGDRVLRTSSGAVVCCLFSSPGLRGRIQEGATQQAGRQPISDHNLSCSEKSSLGLSPSLPSPV